MYFPLFMLSLYSGTHLKWQAVIWFSSRVIQSYHRPHLIPCVPTSHHQPSMNTIALLFNGTTINNKYFPNKHIISKSKVSSKSTDNITIRASLKDILININLSVSPNLNSVPTSDAPPGVVAMLWSSSSNEGCVSVSPISLGVCGEHFLFLGRPFCGLAQ